MANFLLLHSTLKLVFTDSLDWDLQIRLSCLVLQCSQHLINIPILQTRCYDRLKIYALLRRMVDLTASRLSQTLIYEQINQRYEL